MNEKEIAVGSYLIEANIQVELSYKAQGYANCKMSIKQIPQKNLESGNLKYISANNKLSCSLFNEESEDVLNMVATLLAGYQVMQKDENLKDGGFLMRQIGRFLFENNELSYGKLKDLFTKTTKTVSEEKLNKQFEIGKELHNQFICKKNQKAENVKTKVLSVLTLAPLRAKFKEKNQKQDNNKEI